LERKLSVEDTPSSRVAGVRRMVWLGIGMFVVGLVLSRTPAVTASHQWGCYKWLTPSLTYTNQAQSPYSTYYTQETRTDGDSWHNYTVINFTAAGNGNLKEQSGHYGQNGWLGLTQIQVQSCRIVSATSKLNRTYLDNGYSTDARKRVACHEVGHATGLNHNPSSSSCLKTGGSAPSRPNSHDTVQLDAMY
jgi:hypothetical protein